jgi:hypothetical protein
MIIFSNFEGGDDLQIVKLPMQKNLLIGKNPIGGEL